MSVPKVGDEVVVILPADNARETRDQRTRLGRISSVARVWLVIDEVGGSGLSWRMRIATQSEGNESYPQFDARFLTLDQDAAERRRDAASEYLEDKGITIDRRSSWRGREVELADLLKAHEAKR